MLLLPGVSSTQRSQCSGRTPAPVSVPQLQYQHPRPPCAAQDYLPAPSPVSIASPTELVTGALIAATAEVTSSIIEWQQGSTQDCLPLPAWSLGTGRCHLHCPILAPWLGTPNSPGCGEQGVRCRIWSVGAAKLDQGDARGCPVQGPSQQHNPLGCQPCQPQYLDPGRWVRSTPWHRDLHSILGCPSPAGLAALEPRERYFQGVPSTANSWHEWEL